MSDSIQRLRVTIQNERPIELLEFTRSLAAMGDEYLRFRGDKNGVLRIEKITEGSIDAVFTDVGVIAGAIAPVADQAVSAFGKHWVDLLKGLATYGVNKLTDAKTKSAPKASIRNAMSFAHAAIDGNAITVLGDNNTVITGPYIHIDTVIGGDILRHGQHILAPEIAEEARFQIEPMRLYQMRDAKAGDVGFIDRFSAKPRRLIFANDAVKDEMLHGEVSPFDLIFFVSGLVKTAGGEVAGYYIEKIDGSSERDAA